MGQISSSSSSNGSLDVPQSLIKFSLNYKVVHKFVLDALQVHPLITFKMYKN